MSQARKKKEPELKSKGKKQAKGIKESGVKKIAHPKPVEKPAAIIKKKASPVAKIKKADSK